MSNEIRQGPPEPWDFQGFAGGLDTNDSWPAFRFYLTLPHPRRLQDVRTAYQISSGTLSRWAKQGAWHARALLYDERVAAEREEVLAVVREKSNDDSAKEWLRLSELGKKVLETELLKMLNRAQENPFTTFKPNELARLTEVINKVENLARGKPTEIQESSMDLSSLSDAELAAWEELHKKATAKLPKPA